jgi:hypothetical protein
MNEIIFWYNYVYNLIQNLQHKFWVIFYSIKLCSKLLWRALIHDLSKFKNDEAIVFSKYVKDLKNSEFGQASYITCLELTKQARELHYKRNSHHPQHHRFGFPDMSFLDRVEMLIDWKAASRRNISGNMWKSILINQQRFQYETNDSLWLNTIAEEL